MTRTLWIASGNAKKAAEMERLLAPLGIRLRNPTEIQDAPDPEESAPDFAGNAAIKARTLAAHVGAATVADDSGLCVEALSGRPGVRSARWAGPDANDADRIDKLQQELRGAGALEPAQRAAAFVCSLCLVDASGTVLFASEEQCTGHILMKSVGGGGFGYDPAFCPDPNSTESGSGFPTGTSFAQLSATDKDRISHRGKALRRLLAFLRDHSDALDS